MTALYPARRRRTGAVAVDYEVWEDAFSSRSELRTEEEEEEELISS